MSTAKPDPEQPERPRQPEATLAAAALVCSVVGMLMVLVVLPQAGVVLGAFGVTAGWRGRQGNVRLGVATAGLLLGVVTTVIGIVVVIVNVVNAPPV